MSLSISDVATQIGLRSSAIRYYEKIGILVPPRRVSGRRSYDVRVLYRLALVQQARQTGFKLSEIKELFVGFSEGTRASARWQKLTRRKILEFDAMLQRIEFMRDLMKLQERCRCKTLEECGRKIFEERRLKRKKMQIP